MRTQSPRTTSHPALTAVLAKVARDQARLAEDLNALAVSMAELGAVVATVTDVAPADAELLTVPQAAAYLGVSRSLLYPLLDSGAFPA